MLAQFPAGLACIGGDLWFPLWLVLPFAPVLVPMLIVLAWALAWRVMGFAELYLQTRHVRRAALRRGFPIIARR